MMKVVEGGNVMVGIAAEGYDVERDGETYESTAKVCLDDSTTIINPDISVDGSITPIPASFETRQMILCAARI